MSYQGHIILQPGQSFHSQGERKVALCKNGPTDWDRSQSCDYHGPPMKVTVKVKERIEYDGPFSGSKQWLEHHLGGVDLLVVNDTNQESALYVHVE